MFVFVTSSVVVLRIECFLFLLIFCRFSLIFVYIICYWIYESFLFERFLKIDYYCSEWKITIFSIEYLQYLCRKLKLIFRNKNSLFGKKCLSILWPDTLYITKTIPDKSPTEYFEILQIRRAAMLVWNVNYEVI